MNTLDSQQTIPLDDGFSANKFRFIAAPFTPFHENGALNTRMIGPYVEKLRQDGVDGIFIGGTTGEGMSLTEDERRELAEAWKAELDGKMQLIVHVGHAAPDAAASLASHAEGIGADAIAAIGPVFYSASEPEVLVAVNKQIAAAAPRTPFYYYHMPSMSRVGVTAGACFPLFAREIPTFAGIKFTHEDIADFRNCLKLAAGRYEVFFGRDEILLQGLASGARGAVGSTYNFAVPLYRALVGAYLSKDLQEAARLQSLCGKAIEIMVKYGGLPAIKAILSMLGIDCGPVRLPMKEPGLAQKAGLRTELETIGFFEALQFPLAFTA